MNLRVTLVLLSLLACLGCNFIGLGTKPLASDEVLRERFQQQSAEFDRLAEILQTNGWQNDKALIIEKDKLQEKTGTDSSDLMFAAGQRLYVLLAATEYKDKGTCDDFYAHKGFAFSTDDLTKMPEKAKSTNKGMVEYQPLGKNWYIYYAPRVAVYSEKRCGHE